MEGENSLRGEPAARSDRQGGRGGSWAEGYFGGEKGKALGSPIRQTNSRNRASCPGKHAGCTKDRHRLSAETRNGIPLSRAAAE